jgi:hypothetical protein
MSSWFCIAGVLNESRGTAVVHAYLKNENELPKLLDELQDKLGPDSQAGPDPDQSMAVVSLGIQQLLMEIQCVYCEVGNSCFRGLSGYIATLISKITCSSC